MAGRSTGKQMSINVIASIVSFCVTIGINFFLTPYLVKSLGAESYGFIGLANNFVQYATIVTSALNSMSGRFISIAYHNGDKEKASRMFSSVLVANLVIAAVMLIVSSVITCYVDVILNVPSELIMSVKVTFGLTFLTYVISIVTAIFTTAAYVKNRMELNSIRDIISHLLKVAIIILLFTFLDAKLYFIALATLASGIFLMLANMSVKRKILPDVKVDIKKFQMGLVKTLILAGAWVSLNQLSSVLMNGLDLLICNLTISATMMGLMSIAKTVPQSISVLISTLSGVFQPHYTILYAKNKIQELLSEIKFTSKIISFILTVPVAGFIAFGYEFYALWQPTRSPEEIKMIQIMSILTCLMFLFTAHTQNIMSLSTVCNRLKLPVLVSLGVGVVSTAIVLAVLNIFDLGDYGAYIICGVSSVLMSLRSILFIPMYGAHILGQKKRTFYPMILRSCFTFVVILGIFLLIHMIGINFHSWMRFLPFCAGIGVVGYIASVPLLFSRKEISKLTGMLKKKFLKKKA